MSNSLFETYKNSVIPYGKHMFQTESDIAIAKCVNLYHQTMRYHIGNVFCVVLRNFHRWIFQVQNQISTIQMLDQPYNFMCINTKHVVLCMVDALSTKINIFNCVRLLHIQLLLQKIIPKNYFPDGVMHFGLSSRLLHYCNSETCISPTTCTDSWKPSLRQHTLRGIQAPFIFTKMCCTVVIM